MLLHTGGDAQESSVPISLFHVCKQASSLGLWDKPNWGAGAWIWGGGSGVRWAPWLRSHFSEKCQCFREAAFPPPPYPSAAHILCILTSGNLHWGKESQLPASAAGNLWGDTVDPFPSALWVRGPPRLWALSPSPQPGCAVLPPPAVFGPWSQAVSASQAWCQLSAQLGATGKSPAAQVGELHGECPRARSSMPTHLSFLFLQHHRIWPPQPPSRGPSRRGILFDVLKACSGPSQESTSSQNCLTKGPALGTSPNLPGPQLEWGLQEAEISGLALDSSSRTEEGVG